MELCLVLSLQKKKPYTLGDHNDLAHRWWEMAIIFTVFGITGSSSMFFVRPLMTKLLKLEGPPPLLEKRES